ncbi:MAG: ECF-type sigma factor [Acidobacteriota bacterium]|nr:ECF-type sigma factor [Acidobacteriota bacterium]
MNTATPREITPLLLDWNNGDQEALKKLMPLVEAELRRRAKLYMRRQRPGHLLQATALINEVYLRLVKTERVNWENRAHFIAASAQIMRNILVDYYRQLGADKRDGQLVEFGEADAIFTGKSLDLIALDEALKRFAMIDPEKSRIVELRFFGDLTEKEVAEVMKLPLHQVKREWKLAKAWLKRELSK